MKQAIRAALVAAVTISFYAAQEQGQHIFEQHCASCHSPLNQVHAPMPEDLAQMPWEYILQTLETGAMKTQGSTLTAQQRSAVAHYLGKKGPETPDTATSGFCPAGQKPVDNGHFWNGWGVDNLNTRFQPAAAAGLDAAHVKDLRVKWAFGAPNDTAGFSQPTVVGGRVYAGDPDGMLYSLDAKTGCTYWRFKAKARIRAAVVIGPGARAYVGDHESNFYALDASTGRLIWERKVDNQPTTQITGTVKIWNGRLYVPIAGSEENSAADPKYPCCTFRGALEALDATDGHEIWKTFTTPEPKATKIGKNGTQYYGPSGATIWSSPTIDLKRKRIYITTGNGYSDPEVHTEDSIIALDLETGDIRWVRQAVPDMFNWDCGKQLHLVGPSGPGGGSCPDHPGYDVDFGSSVVLVDVGQGRQVLVAGQKSGMVHGLDPDQDGKVLWQMRIGKGGPLGGILWGIAAHDGMVFVPLSDNDPAHPDQGGGLFALDAATGKIVWHTPPPPLVCPAEHSHCTVAQMAPASAMPGVVFSGAMDGYLRAYDMKTGKIVWSFNAARKFPSVDGVPTHGGAFSATGATIVDGMVYVSSGYSGIPGNALLAFGVGR